MKLTEKQKRFADEYIISGNATQAAIKAGYSKKTAAVIGTENLIKPNIKSYIDERLEELKSERTADAQEVLEYLTSVMRGNETEEVLIGIGEGVQSTVQKEVGAKDRLKAAELLGKRFALFTDKTEVAVSEIPTFVDDIDGDDADGS
ncbi:terminase small subunit [Enterococcus cecorum]|uniref:Terminase small subunit n=1 Tax=Enterococcus cecorum TaxID=44008 RepID=A0AAW9JXT5_9ENTE|nr:terminase small subunit [Enterococcus cecorum]MCJ0572351.1 terminase small subunit [Enterococcus cecorum]MCJ0577225.1 terminase small subunit [Enterococcus cecorum]MCJ0584246.1 terminase small subunit [Enterococcus cecorum]MCJ0589565.1 terminase small subunit [Enterococcus cecorum]MDZ5504179.1 terminase small subunit [Enterococcus cecorum]